MNENYIPEDEEILESPPATEEPAPEAQADIPVTDTEEAHASELAENEAEAIPELEETPASEFAENEAEPIPELEENPASELAENEAEPIPELEETPSIQSEDSQVTDIIIETLAQADSEDTPEDALSHQEKEAILDELAQEFAPEETAEETPIQEAAPAEPKKERPVRKGRPKRRKGDGLLSIPHLLSAVIWLLIIVAIGTSLGRIIWVCAADVLAFGRENKEVTISITADDTMESIADKLHDAGLINIPELFLLYADLTDVEEEHKITTGTFTLNTIYDYMALVNHMSPRATNRVVIEDVLIPEGYTCRQIFALLEEKGICKAADLEAYAASGELKDYWFLEGVERGDKYCLEGFLFPDTYDFYENSTPKLALEKMLNGFEYRFTEELFNQIPALNERLTEMMRKNGENEEFIAANQFTLRDVLTVASMIEEETASNSESYRIASVIYNRLFNWGNNPRYLNIDASIIYALEGKTNLTAEDMAVDSPYNTYTNTGLTPGPITNPGLASIMAALNFEDTSYYYYVLNPATGEHQFSKTYEEHQKWVKQFREASNNG